MWSSVLFLPRPSLIHHRSVATSRMFPTAISHIHHKCSVISPSWSLLMTCRILDTNGLMEVIFSNSGGPQPSSCTKEQMAALLLGCCPPTATSTSPGVLACLLVSPLHSPHCAGRHSRPSGHSVRGEAALLEQLLWAVDTTLRCH